MCAKARLGLQSARGALYNEFDYSFVRVPLYAHKYDS